MIDWVELCPPFYFRKNLNEKESLKEDNNIKGKPFTNIDEQINILKNRYLHFENEEIAKAILRRYGYYEIINGYKSPFKRSKG
ncbi:hypothetical protein SDC49_20185 [Lactobacillus sp. R2/2]|nr:hypothetical protein [Lactobacillus sp. R2/2]